MSYGNAGWVRAVTLTAAGRAVTYLRLQPDHDGTLRVTEMYVNENVTVDRIKRVSVATIEAMINNEDREYVERRLNLPAPKLDAVLDMFGPIGPAPDIADLEPAIDYAPGAPMTPKFLAQVGAAYAFKLANGERHPAKAIASDLKINVRTVQTWIYNARKRGIMPKGTRGKAAY
jgi:hypothetical protein